MTLTQKQIKELNTLLKDELGIEMPKEKVEEIGILIIRFFACKVRQNLNKER